MARTVPRPSGNATTSEPRAPRTSRARAAGSTAQGSAGASSAPQPTPPTLKPDERKLRESLVQMYTMAGGFIQVKGDMSGDIGLSTAGVNIHSRAGDAADVWIDLARQNAQVKRALMGFTQGSAAVGVLAMNAMMVVPVLSARGMVRPEFGAMALSDEAKRHWSAKYAEAQAAAATATATAPSNGGAQ